MTSYFDIWRNGFANSGCDIWGKDFGSTCLDTGRNGHGHCRFRVGGNTGDIGLEYRVNM